MNFLPIAVGFIAIGVAIWHEWTWHRRQQHCVRLVGRIVAEIEDEHDVTIRWKIEYDHDGVARQFVSGYGGSSTMQVGDDANVVLDLRTDVAEHSTWSNRWVFTIGPMLLGVAFLLAGISMIWQDQEQQNQKMHPSREVGRFDN